MKIENFIICDDIRFELHGKQSLIGIYDESIQFIINPTNKNRWPRALKISLHTSIKFETKDKRRNIESFAIKTDYNGSVKELIHEKFPPEKDFFEKKLNISLINDRFIFEGPGEIKFLIEFYGKKKLIETLSPDYILKVSEKEIS